MTNVRPVWKTKTGVAAIATMFICLASAISPSVLNLSMRSAIVKAELAGASDRQVQVIKDNYQDYQDIAAAVFGTLGVSSGGLAFLARGMAKTKAYTGALIPGYSKKELENEGDEGVELKG